MRITIETPDPPIKTEGRRFTFRWPQGPDADAETRDWIAKRELREVVISPSGGTPQRWHAFAEFGRIGELELFLFRTIREAS